MALKLPEIAVAAGIGFAGVVALGDNGALPFRLSLAGESTGTACDIKGNISPNTSERIYHMPGQRYYVEMRISPAQGERWFCSEAEARAAGWRRSRV